jgi:hypothetical protein
MKRLYLIIISLLPILLLMSCGSDSAYKPLEINQEGIIWQGYSEGDLEILWNRTAECVGVDNSHWKKPWLTILKGEVVSEWTTDRRVSGSKAGYILWDGRKSAHIYFALNPLMLWLGGSASHEYIHYFTNNGHDDEAFNSCDLLGVVDFTPPYEVVAYLESIGSNYTFKEEETQTEFIDLTEEDLEYLVQDRLDNINLN